MQESWECPNCNSDLVVPDGRRLQGRRVLHCRNCTSWFTEDNGEPVLFEDDGGDDLPDLGIADGTDETPSFDDDDRGFSGNPDLIEVQGF